VKDADGGGRDGGKRKQLRFEICAQCEEEYNVGDNLDGDCVWHSGMSCSLPCIPICTGAMREATNAMHDTNNKATRADTKMMQAKPNQTWKATSGPIMTRIVTGRLIPSGRGRSIQRGLCGAVVSRTGMQTGVRVGCMCRTWGRGRKLEFEGPGRMGVEEDGVVICRVRCRLIEGLSGSCSLDC
jgi:hypothetical protein